MKVLADVQGNAQDLFRIEATYLVGKRLTAFAVQVGFYLFDS